MNKHLIYLTSILNAGILFFGCFAGLNQYQPRSVEEEAVIKVVMEHERTWRALQQHLGEIECSHLRALKVFLLTPSTR